jgi:hypothetical protein
MTTFAGLGGVRAGRERRCERRREYECTESFQGRYCSSISVTTPPSTVIQYGEAWP